MLGEKLKAGEDVHLYTASHLLGISFAEAKRRIREPEVQAARQDAKAANFGFPGGMRERTFMITQIKQREKFWKIEDARRLRDAWLEAFPEMSEYFDACSFELGPERRAVIELPFTKRLRLVRGLPMCCNTYFQGPASDGALAALNEVSRRCYVVEGSKLYNARLCNFVHDEIILEIREDEDLHGAAMEFQKVMEAEFTKFTPDYPVSVEPVLMRYWSKAARPVFVDGKLTIWASS